MSSLNKAFLVEKTGNIMMPKCRMVYPNLFQPTQVKGQGKAKYRISLLIPKAADIALLTDTIRDIAKDALGSKLNSTKWRNPLIKTADEPRFSEIADDFPWMVRPNSDNRPQVVGPSLKAILEDQEADEVYGGRWCRVSLNPYFYSADKSPVPGVGLGLSNVQLLDHDEPLGGGRVTAEAEFEAVEAGELEGMEA